VTFVNKLRRASAQDPNLDWANLSYYWDKNEQLNLQSNLDYKIVFMGDSITEEWGNLYPEFFKSPKYLNRGIGGQTTPQMLIRFKQDVIALKPDITVILAGTNDIAGNTGPSTTEMITNNIFSMGELASQYKIKTVISSILPVFEYSWAQQVKNVPDTINEINNVLKKYAKNHNLFYIDYFSSMVDEQGGLKLEYTYDGVHPNKMGYEVMSSIANKTLLKIID